MRKFLDVVNKYRYYDYNHLYKEVRFWLYFSIIIILLVLLISGVIRIFIEFNTQNNGFLFTIMNALVWYVYLNAIGIGNRGTTNKNLKYIIILIGILLVLLGFGYFNIRFFFGFWFFNYQYFSLSSPDGIFFFWTNQHIFLPLFFITFLTESEVIE